MFSVLSFARAFTLNGINTNQSSSSCNLNAAASLACVPVEGTVTEVNKGGYVVEVSGQRCFCPLGQMDLRRIEDPATMVGQRLLFRVTEVRSGKDVVVSRKALLEAEQHKKGAETRKSLAVGARFKGSGGSLRDFGAFVDLGGVEGLIPASELGFGRSRPQDVLHAGQEVDVEVVRMEPGKDGNWANAWPKPPSASLWKKK